MDIGAVQQQRYAEDQQCEYEVDFVNKSTRCHRCGGWGHVSRVCPTEAGKGDATKGPGKRNLGKGGPGHAKVGFGGKFGGTEEGGKKSKGDAVKGEGKGYQGTCHRCGKDGHKQNECRSPNKTFNVKHEQEGDQEEHIEHVGCEGDGVRLIAGVDTKKAAPWRSSQLLFPHSARGAPRMVPGSHVGIATSRTLRPSKNRYEMLEDKDGATSSSVAGIARRKEVQFEGCEEMERAEKFLGHGYCQNEFIAGWGWQRHGRSGGLRSDLQQ